MKNQAAYGIAASCVFALVSACSSTRVGDRSGAPLGTPSGAPAAAPASAATSPAQASELGNAPQSPAPQTGAAPPSNDQPTRAADTVVATCVPPPTLSKPKHPHNRKSKATAKAAPAGPASAPAIAETPPGALINADVGELGSSVMSILGKKVQGPEGEDLGRVIDVLADASGRVRVAVIDFGGFLGVGTRRIAVDWPLLRFDPAAGDKSVLLSLSRTKLQSAPEYKDSTHPQVLIPPVEAAPAAADATAAKK